MQVAGLTYVVKLQRAETSPLGGKQQYCEIEILDFESGVKTQHGSDRYVVKIKHEGTECKFFTNSTPIKEALSKISKKDFPFITTIRVKKLGVGNSKMYYFT
jgi:hypothetical protein